MLESPCKPDCPERTPTCHAECPRYIAFDIINDIQRDKIRQEKEKEYNIRCTSRHSKKKKRRRPYADNRGNS